MDIPANGTRRGYARLAGVKLPAGASRADRMRLAVDALWETMGTDRPDVPNPARGVSWIGFYLRVPGEGRPGHELLLGPCRDKPACSPIGLHGMCGRGWQDRASIVIDDVRSLGEGYIACDPRDQSELVVPLLDADGSCWGVLDADSYQTHAFSEHDARELAALMALWGLSHADAGSIRVQRL
jgi:putative methionine-R-sulfoxide reductase with GAF domain